MTKTNRPEHGKREEGFLQTIEAAKLAVARPNVTTRPEFRFSGKGKKEGYLKKMAKNLDILRNHPEKRAEDPLLMTLTKKDEDDLEAYLCDVIADDVQSRARCLARRFGEGAYYEHARALFSYLLCLVLKNLHKYNNPDYLTDGIEYSFWCFIRKYEKEAVLELLSYDRGLKKRMIVLMNAIEKAKEQIVKEEGVRVDLISEERICEKLGDMLGRYSKKYVSDALWLMKEGFLCFDLLDDHLVRPVVDPLRAVENECFGDKFREFLKTLRPLQVYTFLKRATIDEKRNMFDVMKEDEILKKLISEDEYYSAEVQKQPDGSVEGVSAELVCRIYYASRSRVRIFVKKEMMEMDDLRGVLEAIIEQEVYKY